MKWPTQEEIDTEAEEAFPLTGQDSYYIDPAVDAQEGFKYALKWLQEKIPTSELERRKYIRSQAVTLFELIKGFTTETNDNAMKAAIDMAGYVLELTNHDYQR